LSIRNREKKGDSCPHGTLRTTCVQNRRMKTKTVHETSPLIGFVRLPQVLEIFPISKSAWWQGIRSGRFPKPIRLGPRTVAWRAQDIHDLIERFSGEGAL